MEKQETNSEFLKKVEDFADTLKKEADNEKYIILAAETPKGEGNLDTTHFVSVGGYGSEVIKCISSFATQSDTRELFIKGLRLSTMMTIINKLSKD